MNYAVLGETKDGNLYTRYETSIPEAEVLRNGKLVEERNPDSAREVVLYWDQKTGTVGKIEVTQAENNSRLRSDPSAAIIAGKLFQVGAPIAGSIIDEPTYTAAKPVLEAAAKNLGIATFSFDVSFTGDRLAGAASKGVAQAQRLAK